MPDRLGHHETRKSYVNKIFIVHQTSVAQSVMCLLLILLVRDSKPTNIEFFAKILSKQGSFIHGRQLACAKRFTPYMYTILYLFDLLF